jgi:hypothetical protein
VRREFIYFNHTSECKIYVGALGHFGQSNKLAKEQSFEKGNGRRRDGRDRSGRDIGGRTLFNET